VDDREQGQTAGEPELRGSCVGRARAEVLRNRGRIMEEKKKVKKQLVTGDKSQDAEKLVKDSKKKIEQG